MVQGGVGVLKSTTRAGARRLGPGERTARFDFVYDGGGPGRGGLGTLFGDGVEETAWRKRLRPSSRLGRLWSRGGRWAPRGPGAGLEGAAGFEWAAPGGAWAARLRCRRGLGLARAKLIDRAIHDHECRILETVRRASGGDR